MWKFWRQRWWRGFVFAAVVKVSNPEPEIPAVFSLGDKQLSGRHTCTFHQSALLCFFPVCTGNLFYSAHCKAFLQCTLQGSSPVCTAKLFCSVFCSAFPRCTQQSFSVVCTGKLFPSVHWIQWHAELCTALLGSTLTLFRNCTPHSDRQSCLKWPDLHCTSLQPNGPNIFAHISCETVHLHIFTAPCSTEQWQWNVPIHHVDSFCLFTELPEILCESPEICRIFEALFLLQGLAGQNEKILLNQTLQLHGSSWRGRCHEDDNDDIDDGYV